MFSKKEVFESYVGELGLSKTALEAVKGINGVLFESSIDDLLDNFDDDAVSPVSEEVPGEPKEEPVEAKKEYTSSELDYKLKVPFDAALRLAFAWAHNENRFDLLWNEHGGIDRISFMIPSDNGEHVFFSSDRVLYEISAEGEDGVPKYTYETATNMVKMSQNVHDRIMNYYEEKGSSSDLSEIPFNDIKRLVLGNGLHQTGEEAPNIGIACTVSVDPSAILLSTEADDRDMKTGEVTPNEANRKQLQEEYGIPVESLYSALMKEWTDASDRYYMDSETGIVYDVTKDSKANAMSDKDTLAPFAKKTKDKKENALKLNMKVIDWAKRQDMFKLLLKPNAAGVPKLVYTSTIYKVPNDGNIEGITGNTPYVYMDDDNYASYVNSNQIDQSQVSKIDVANLNTLVSDEYNKRSVSNTSSANLYGYDENGWVNSVECKVADDGSYVLADNVASQIRNAYGRNVAGINNYIAGKNTITIGGKSDEDGNVAGGVACHPLILLDRTRGGSVVPRLVAVFDDTCCKPGDSLSKIVGVDGLRGGTPTIYGFATILNNCNLEKSGDFIINECVLSNVDISGSTGFVRIGARRSRSGVASPMKTVVSNTIIAVGNNGADQSLPNNRIAAEMSGGMRGVSIVNSVISDSTIENGYADIQECNIKNLNMSNPGSKTLKEWSTEDASNVEFKGNNAIIISGYAKYKKGMTKSVVAGARGQYEYEKSDVVTKFTGNVTLDSTAGTVICKGSTMENVVANGPCNIRTCTLKGTTIGVNADDNGTFEMTDLNCVSTIPGGDSASFIQIEHGSDKATVFGSSTKDKTPGLIELSGRVFVEGGAHVFHSNISSPDNSQLTYVRSNMTLSGCSPYSLNERDSGLLSRYIHEGDNLSGDCTDVNTVAKSLQYSFNTFGGSNNMDTPLKKYEQFKTGSTDASLQKLTVFDSETLVDDFLQDTGSVLMDNSVFLDINGNGEIVPNEDLKRTIWDPIGGFFVGAVNKRPDGSTNYGAMVLLKCPNVVLDHDAILRKKNEFVQNMDFDMYASGKITLRQYVDFLDDNGFSDCYHYVEGNGFGKDFIQLCLIGKNDMRTPRKLSLEQMQILVQNAKRIVAQFLTTDTSSKTSIRDVDSYDSITTAYTDNNGGMVVETDNGRTRYTYSAPRADDVGETIQSQCEKRWRDDEGKTHYDRYTVDCGIDAMYKYGYQYLLNTHSTSNTDSLVIIRKAITGNTEGLGKKDYLSSAVNAMKGEEMKSNDISPLMEDDFTQILDRLDLQKGEKVYFLQGNTSEGVPVSFIAKGKLVYPRADEAERYRNAGCQKMKYRRIKYSRDDDTFIVSPDWSTYPVKMRNKLKPGIVRMEHLLAREATLDDFVNFLGVPDPRM